MSSAVERAISQTISPLIGVRFSKYCPLTGGTQAPPMKLS
jgi:hypothetical protein